MNIQPYHRPIHKKYATEESRRSTYYDKDNWPLKDQSFVEKLVEAGFYYTEDDDDPWIQHAMWNPNCSYIQLKMGEDWGDFVKKTMKIKENLYRTPAIKTRSNITEIDWNTLLGLDFTKELLLSDFPTRAVRDALELQILLKKTPFISRNDCINTSKYDSSIISLYRYRYSFTLPYPEYSFDGRFYIEYTTKHIDCKITQGKPVGNIPIYMSDIINKIKTTRKTTVVNKNVNQSLEGISDHVSCFHCGVGLRNWEDDDDPWKLHAIWSASCHYVYLQKGEAFINKVRRESNMPISGSVDTLTEHNLNHPVSSSVNAVTEHDWNHLLGLDYTRKILMLGFPTVAVRDALRDQVIQTGIPFSSEVECISAVCSLPPLLWKTF
nr:E3 ubiquitin-protein ligase XIAP-like [Penaeus vannamei]